MLLSALIAAIIGLLVGGLLNALADDLPHYRTPRLPRYPDGEPRPPAAWLGVLAFALGKRASSKGAKLSWRYPLTELGTAALMALTVITTADDEKMSTLRLLFYLVYMAFFVLVTVIDVEHRLILFAVVIPFGVVALLDALIEPFGPNLGSALGGAAVGFGVFFLMYLGGYVFIYISNALRERKLNTVAFGYGDVMLITVSGLILGWEQLIFTMFITVFLGAAGAILWLVGRALATGRYNWFTPLPYGPYIVAATIIMMLFATEVGFVLLR